MDLVSSHHAALFTELIFNYGDEFEVEGRNVVSLYSGNSQYILSGLKTQPFQTTVSGEHINIGFLLKPHGYGLLIDKFATNYMDMFSDLLYEQLIAPSTPQFDKVEPFLFKLFRSEPIDSHIAKFISTITPLLTKKGALREFNETISISQKSFIQKFKKLYFLTPSEYLRLTQTQVAAHLMITKPDTSLTEIGSTAGFYDQSHFIKVFSKHYGYAPKLFRSMNQTHK